MSESQMLSKVRPEFGLITFAFVIAVSACASVPTLSSVSWKEEVLLHDGNTVIAKRSQSNYGLRRGPVYTPPIKEQYVTFSVPGSKKSVTWRSEYSEDIGHSNSKAVALHILNNVPYVIAVPYLCQSYNKWGRPNPPYVIFRYDGQQWQRISIAELPLEFKEINLVVAPEADEKTIRKQSIVSAELVRELNSTLDQPEYQSILREELQSASGSSIVSCEEMIYYKCGWISPHGDFGREFMDSSCKE